MKFLRFLPILGLLVLLAGCNRKEQSANIKSDQFRLVEPKFTLRNNVQGFDLTSLPLEQIELTDSLELVVENNAEDNPSSSSLSDYSEKFTLSVFSNCDVGDGSNTKNQKLFETPRLLSVYQLIPSNLFLEKTASETKLSCSFEFEAKNQIGSTHRFEISKVKIIADRMSGNMVFPHWMNESSNKTAVKEGSRHFILSEFTNELLSAGPSQLRELNFNLMSDKNFKQVLNCEHLRLTTDLIKTGTFSGAYFLKKIAQHTNQNTLSGTQICRISILDEHDELLYFTPHFNMSWSDFGISVTFDKKDRDDEFVLNRLRSESDFFGRYALPMILAHLVVENKGGITTKVVVKNIGGEYLPFVLNSESAVSVVSVMKPEIGIMGPVKDMAGVDLILELAPHTKYELPMFLVWIEKCDYVRDFIGYGFTSLDGITINTFLRDSAQNWKEVEIRKFLPAARNDLFGPAGVLTSAVSATAQDGENNLAITSSIALMGKRLDQMNITRLCH